MLTRRNALMMLVAALLVAIVAPEVVQAQAAASATGTWKWTQAGRGGGRGRGAPGAPGGAPPASQPAGGAAAPAAPGAPADAAAGGRRGGRGGGAPIDVTLDLKQDGEKLTGSVVGMTPADTSAKVDISDGTIKGSDLTFKVSRANPRGGDPIVTTYKGKIDGDTIKGTMETPFGGNPATPADWTATRAKKS